MLSKAKFSHASIQRGKEGRASLKIKFELEEELEHIGKFIFDSIATEEKLKEYNIPIKIFDSDTVNDEISKIFKDRIFYLDIIFEHFKNEFHPKIIRIL